MSGTSSPVDRKHGASEGGREGAQVELVRSRTESGTAPDDTSFTNGHEAAESRAENRVALQRFLSFKTLELKYESITDI